MTTSLQSCLDGYIEQSGLPNFLHDVAARATQTDPGTPPMPLSLSTRRVTLTHHPLDALHSLLTTATRGLQTRDPDTLRALFQAAPKHLRNAVYHHVWLQATDPNKNQENWAERNAFSDLPRLLHAVKAVASTTLQKIPAQIRNDIYFQVWSLGSKPITGGDRWGEKNALADLPRLLLAVKTVVETRLESLPEQKKNTVYGTIYRMAGSPNTSDPKWGEHHALENTSRLICALHRNECLDIAGGEILCFARFEKEAENHSRFFHLHRQEPERGQIGFINGMACTRYAAGLNAVAISDSCAQGRNIHCVYSATTGSSDRDIASGILGCAGFATPAVLLLLEQWQDFFEKDANSRLLQLCTSRGAIEVNNALEFLPPEMRQRLIVVTIAPACLIPAEMAFKVANLVIPSDPVPQNALNRHLMNAPHTILLNEHTDTPNPHSLLGSSYREWLTPRIDAYIRTNDLAV